MVREAHPAEAPALLDLVRALDAESEALPREPGERPVWCADDPVGDLAGFQARDTSTVFVAEAEGGLVGQLSAAGGRHQRNRGTVTLSVGVRKSWQGRGIGTALFEAAGAWAARGGVHRLQLTVAAGNDRAHALYRRLGFIDEGVFRRALRVRGTFRDERLMGRLLLPADVPVWPPLVLDALPPAATNGLLIREAEPADAAAWLACDRAVRAETPFLLRTAAESVGDEAAARRMLAAQRASRRAAILLALADGGVAGTIALWANPFARSAHEATLGIAVRREYWGSGIGRRLLAAGREWCRDRGVLRLTLWVLAHNTRARRLYASCGFGEEAVARRYALIDGRYADHILMAAWLGDESAGSAKAARPVAGGAPAGA